MSFAKAKVKRFNECDVFVPPVGSYDPKLQDTSISGSFLRSDRFRSEHNLSTASSNSLENVQTNAAFKMPQRTRSFSSTVSDSDYNGKIRECENEIRRLLRERSKNLKDLSSKEDEIKKLDNKLQCTIRERTSLRSSLITLEKENKELRRSTDLLKAKVSVYGAVEKKKDLAAEVLAVTEKLVRKDHEVSDLRAELLDVRRELEELVINLSEKDTELNKLKSEMNFVVSDVESESEAAKAKLSDLEESNEILKQSSEEMQEQLNYVLDKLASSEAAVVELKDERSQLANELVLCQKELEAKENEASKVEDDLRKENLVLLDRVEEQTSKRQFQEKVLSLELDNAHQKLASTENCTRALQDYKDALVGRISSLKDTVVELENQQTIDMQTIKSLKVEVANLSSKLADKKKALHVTNSEITALKEQINELQNVHLEGTEKMDALESELRDSKMHEETLQGELLVTRLALQVAEGDIMEFRKCLSEIKADLDCEKEEVLKHQNLLEENKREIATKEHEHADILNRLKDEISSKENQISYLTVEFKKQLEKQQTDVEELNREIVLKEAEFDDRFTQLQKDKDEKKVEIEDLVSRFEEEKEKHKVEMEIFNLEANSKEVEFKTAIEQLANDIKTKETQIVTLSSTVDTMILSAHSLKLQIQEEENENVKLKEKLLEKEKQIDVVKNTIAVIRVDQLNLKESLTAIRVPFEEQKRAMAFAMEGTLQEVAKLKAAADIAEKEFGAMKKAKEQFEGEIKDGAAREKKMVEENSELSSLLEAKTLQIEELNRSVSTLKVQAKALIDDFTIKQADFDSNRQILDAKLQSKETELVAALLKLQESHVAAESSIANLRTSLTRMEAEKYDKEMLYLEIKNMRNILHDELRQTQRELNETENKLESSETMTKNLLEKIESLKNVNTVRETKIKASMERVLELQNDVSANAKELQNLKVQLERKRFEADDLNVAVRNLTESCQEKDNEISELRNIIEQNQQLAKDKSLVEDLTTTMDELNRLLETSKEQALLIQEMHGERKQFEETIQQQKQEIQLHTATIEWYSDREKEILGEFDVLEAKAKDGQETKRILAELQKEFSMMEGKFQSYRERKENEGRQNEVMVQALTNDYETKLKRITADANEKSYWQKMYEDLVLKVEPFMEQLDAFEIERNVLMSKEQETTSSLAKLSDQYAKLLGHQNHKQKIHYMINLKEELLKLREENTKLRMDVLKYQKSAQRKDVPGTAPRSVRPTDSAKRFQHPNKENNGTPLRDRNYI